jgi:2-octaprenyl-6-methoxyphenol hydroxylase
MARKEKMQNHDLIISGGGIPGLALAALLGGLGMDVAVIDPNRPNPLCDVRVDGRTAALMAGSVNVLKATGAWDACAKYGGALETLRIVEDRAEAEFRAGDIGHPCFGINMPLAILRSALYERLSKIPCVSFIEDRLVSFDADDFGVTVTLSGALQKRARLLIAADGRDSVIRSLCGINVWQRDYGQKAITCLIRHSRPHANISTEYHRPGGPFTLVPLPENFSSVVWVEYDGDAEKFLALRRNDFERALQERTGGLLGHVTLAENPHSWPLKALRAQSLTAPRIALMAEAAHILHPLGAQGLNLSLRDVAALAEEITDAARRGQDIGSKAVLHRYEFRRRADVLTRSFGTDSLNRMVSNNRSLLRELRHAGLKTITAIRPLRRLAMNEGILPGYDDSRLSRGESL